MEIQQNEQKARKELSVQKARKRLEQSIAKLEKKHERLQKAQLVDHEEVLEMIKFENKMEEARMIEKHKVALAIVNLRISGGVKTHPAESPDAPNSQKPSSLT